MSEHTAPHDPPRVLLAIESGVARIVFNRPGALNAIDVGLAQAFLAACRAVAAARTDVRVVTLSAAGRAFMAGGDLRAFRDQGAAAADELIVPLHEALRTLAEIDAPSISILQGAIAGAGVGIALSTDFAIAADDASFNLAYAKIGASLDGGSSWVLPRIVGLRRALELALLAESVSAADALALNLVNRVVPLAQLSAEATKWVDRLAVGPTRAYGQIRALLKGSFDHDLAAQLERERVAFNECAGTSDFAEGVAAFFARRPASFTGGD